MSPEDFDPDLLGFAVSIVGMIVCVVGCGALEPVTNPSPPCRDTTLAPSS